MGSEKDSERRQAEAVAAYATGRYEITKTFYDAAISGADPIDARPGFVRLLDYCQEHGIGVVLVENAGRFARDLAVQLTGHELLRKRGIELIPVDAPSYFTDPSPTAELVRQILGAVAQFEKAALVAKLRHARTASEPHRVAVRAGSRCRLIPWPPRVSWRAEAPKPARGVVCARSRPSWPRSGTLAPEVSHITPPQLPGCWIERGAFLFQDPGRPARRHCRKVVYRYRLRSK